MRLPWLQVDQDGLTRCRLLARLLGVPEAQGIGLGMALWQWALEIAEEGDFRGLVPDPALMAAALGWAIDDSARLITELQRVGLIATTPGLRVRGLDRYIRGWEKNTKRKAIYRGSDCDVPEPGTNPAPLAPVPARQTQTQTQKKTRGSMSSPPEQDRGSLTPTLSPPQEDKNSQWDDHAEAFIAWAKTQWHTLEDPGPAVTKWARAFFHKHQPADPELIRVAFAKFLIWCHQAGKTVGWGLWLSDNVWEPRWAEVRADSQARGAA